MIQNDSKNHKNSASVNKLSYQDKFNIDHLKTIENKTWRMTAKIQSEKVRAGAHHSTEEGF